MLLHLDLSRSFDKQMDQLKSKYRAEIQGIEKAKRDTPALIREILKIYSKDWHYETRGHGQMLPAYYVLKQEFNLAWILTLFLHIRWRAYPDKKSKLELENPELNPAKPFFLIPDNLEEIEKKNYAPLSPFVADNPAYNDRLFAAYTENKRKSFGEPYDPSPKARYDDLRDFKQFHMTYFSINEQLEILPLAFHQERYPEFSEMLFRLRYILSTGEPPKVISEGPKHRHFAPWFNMYDCWFQARFAGDECDRKALAWQALFWYLDTGLRSVGTTHLREFIQFTDFCEIIGEFELLGERQGEFLRHFKKWTMHASMTHYKKMREDPIQPIPFGERNLPTYDEIREMYQRMAG